MVFHLDLWFDRYYRLKQHMPVKIVHARPLRFNKHFLIPWTMTEKVCYMDVNFYSTSQMCLQRNSISLHASKDMNGFATIHQLHQRPFLDFY